MPAASLDFTSTAVDSLGNPTPNNAEQGSTFIRVFTIYTGATTDPPMDLASVTAIKMQVRTKVGGTVVVEASTTNSRVIIASPTTLGKFTITIPEAIMEACTPCSANHPYVYDIKVTFQDGSVLRYFEGYFEIKAAVTRDA